MQSSKDFIKLKSTIVAKNRVHKKEIQQKKLKSSLNLIKFYNLEETRECSLLI